MMNRKRFQSLYQDPKWPLVRAHARIGLGLLLVFLGTGVILWLTFALSSAMRTELDYQAYLRNLQAVTTEAESVLTGLPESVSTNAGWQALGQSQDISASLHALLLDPQYHDIDLVIVAGQDNMRFGVERARPFNYTAWESSPINCPEVCTIIYDGRVHLFRTMDSLTAGGRTVHLGIDLEKRLQQSLFDPTGSFGTLVTFQNRTFATRPGLEQLASQAQSNPYAQRATAIQLTGSTIEVLTFINPQTFYSEFFVALGGLLIFCLSVYGLLFYWMNRLHSQIETEVEGLGALIISLPQSITQSQPPGSLTSDTSPLLQPLTAVITKVMANLTSIYHHQAEALRTSEEHIGLLRKQLNFQNFLIQTQRAEPASDEYLTTITQMLSDVFNYQYAAIYLYYPGSSDIAAQAQSYHTQHNLAATAQYQVIISREILINWITRNNRPTRRDDQSMDETTASANFMHPTRLTLPIQVDQSFYGALIVERDEFNPITEDEISWLQGLSDLLALNIHNQLNTNPVEISPVTVDQDAS